MPPWVAAPPDNAQWRITLQPAKGKTEEANKPDAKQPRELQQVLCETLGKTKRDIRIYSDGLKEEYWYVDGLELMPVRPGASEIMVSILSAGGATEAQMMTDPVSSQGFAGVGWIKKADYRDTVQYMNVKCFHYARDKEGWEAWIGTDTKLPVAFKAGDTLYVYTFETPPGPPTLPPAYQRVFDDYHKQVLHKQQLLRDLGGQR